jgi:hypothetical protein
MVSDRCVAALPQPSPGRLPSATVGAISPDSAVSQPPDQVAQDDGAPLSTVTAENAQTADVDRLLPPPPVSLNYGIFGDEEEWGMGTA